MSYRYIEDEATADIAFEAVGKDLPQVFENAGDALINVMIENLEAIQPRETRPVELHNSALDLLLIDYLQELIYYKDSQQLLLRAHDLEITKQDEDWHLSGLLKGERLDSRRHPLLVDVKAVTLHNFSLKQNDHGWRAHVILDI